MSIDPASVTLRDLAIGDAGWLIQRHAELYAADQNFDISFEALVAEILAEYIRSSDPMRERAWIAMCGETRLGSVFCTRGAEPKLARLRMLLLEPEARGLGLGKRLLEECIGFARTAGYDQMMLWTHESHREACALYEKRGFVKTGVKPSHSFGVDLVEVTYELDL